MILVDSGPLIAAAIVKQRHHRACVDLFTGLGLAGTGLLVPHTVVAETAYMLHNYAGVRAESAFIRSLAQGDFMGTEILDVDYARVAELIERYDDLPLGTTDASVIALAERLDIREIATLDRRHFTAVRPSHVEAFTLLPETLA